MGRAEISKICSHNMLRARERVISANGFTSLTTRVFSKGTKLQFPCLALAFFYIMSGVNSEPTECGDYLKASNETKIATLVSVTNHSLCRWLIEATNFLGYGVEVEVHFFFDVDKLDACDIVEVRDHDCRAPVLGDMNCTYNNISQIFQSTSKYICVTYISLALLSKGQVNISYHQYLVPDKKFRPTADPKDCYLHEFECKTNRVCVSKSYLCDGINDCGCEDWDCDEGDHCSQVKLIENHVAYWTGFGSGVCLMIIVMTIGLIVENRQHSNYEARKLAVEAFKKKKQAAAAAAI